MGLLWDTLIRRGEIHQARQHTEALEARINQLEVELRKSNEDVMSLLRALEQRLNDAESKRTT